MSAETKKQEEVVENNGVLSGSGDVGTTIVLDGTEDDKGEGDEGGGEEAGDCKQK